MPAILRDEFFTWCCKGTVTLITTSSAVSLKVRTTQSEDTLRS